MDIKVFKTVCPNLNQCQTIETGNELIKELKNSILRKAAVYEKQNQLKRGTKIYGDIFPDRKQRKKNKN